MSAIENIFGRDGFFWWLGVVEDRNDPLKVGRCRVRILGYHVDNKEVLATSDLPWAIPMMPMTSASVSGVGNTPLGPVPGTWVIGFYIDGKDKQQPMMLGTISGFPEEGCTKEISPDILEVLKDNNNNIIKDETGTPIVQETIPATVDNIIQSTSITSNVSEIFPPLSAFDIKSLMAEIAKLESSSTENISNYTARNQLGFRGKYQFGMAALISLNYMVKPANRTYSNADMEISQLWTGKNGIKSLNDFLANKNRCQEIIMVEYLKYNYDLLKNNTIKPSGSKGDAAGLLWVAHNQGHGGARLFKRGIIKKDANGTTATQNYILGKTLFKEDTSILPVFTNPPNSPKANKNQPDPETTKPTELLNDPAIGQPAPYSDPTSHYPRCDYVNRPDTNKLATSDTEGTLVDAKLIFLVDNIERANKVGSWMEPDPAYCGRYPFNHVIESESGHVIEMDDTPNRERLHLYHRVGTYVEMDQNGSYHKHVQGDDFEICIHNKHVYVRGDCDVTVEGSKRTLVKDVMDLEVFGQTTINIKNTATINVRDAANINVGSSANITVQQDVNLTAIQNINMNASGNFNLRASGIQLESTGDVNIKSSNNMNIDCDGKLSIPVGGDLDIRSQNDINMDADNIFTQENKANPSNASESGLSDYVISEEQSISFLANTESANTSPFEDLTREECSKEGTAKFTDDAGEDPEKITRDISSGVKSLEQILVGEARINLGCSRSDLESPKIISPINYRKGEFASYKEYPYTIQLSKHFTLGDLANCGSNSAIDNDAFWNNPKRNSWQGLTKSQLLDNLRGLAVNVLDPIKERFPNMQVTSCMRFTVPTGGVLVSQHLIGQAADISFGLPNTSYEPALWIRDNVAYDQMILEYQSAPNEASWIHVSFNPVRNRPLGTPFKVATFMNGRAIPDKQYLCDLS